METPLVAGREPIWQTLRSSLRYAAGLILEWIHAPARIREFEHVDPETNETIYLATGARYSVLHVGNKRLFFNRVTGRFDGTGQLLLEEGVTDRVELLD